jgi:tetratricopeptide (TPR) repeat protein
VNRSRYFTLLVGPTNRRVAQLALLLIWVWPLWLTGCSDPADNGRRKTEAQAHHFAPNAKAVELNNRGVGLMAHFDYGEASQVFEQLVARYPEWSEAQVNLAIAILNRQREGDEQMALGLVDRLLQQHPGHLRAHYIAGLLRLYLGSPSQALGHFRRVVEDDPEDAYATYYLAQCLAQQSDFEQALAHYRQASALDPYLRSSYYGAFQMLRRLQRREQARALMAQYQRLAQDPHARLAEFKYTRMGPKAEALAVGVPQPQRSPLPPGPAFEKSKALISERTASLRWKEWDQTRAASLTAVDINADQRLDLFIANALAGSQYHNLILIQQPDGQFAPDLTHPLTSVAQVNAALWGDFDNDGLVDVYLARNGPNQLMRQHQPGKFKDVTTATQTSGGNRNTRDGLFFDADHDGDLDLFLVNGDGSNELLNNNRNGTFEALADPQGIVRDGRGSQQVIPIDMDSDRDTDLIIINPTPPHAIYRNERFWRYDAVKAAKHFLNTPALTAVPGDLNADGMYEVYTVTPDGEVLRWRLSAEDNPVPEEIGKIPSNHSTWATMMSLDVNGDGVLELVVTTPTGWSVVAPERRGTGLLFTTVGADNPALAGATAFLNNPSKGPAIVGLKARGGPVIWDPGSGRHAYLALELTGAQDPGQSMRSNASGIGAQIAVRVDSHWTALDTFPNHSGPGQGAQPQGAGLGGARHADFVTIDWSDGVFQSELALEAGRLHRIHETQRQLSSCPVLFAWDGKRYAFVTDLLGVGGLGYALGPPGEYATPRPRENLLLPAQRLAPKDGDLVLKISEPMEEATYLDAVRLVAYDVPTGWQMVLDERMGVLGPPPTGKVHTYRHELLPVDATNERMDTVSALVTHADGRAAPVGTLDPRFLGRLAEEHVLTLRFSDPLDSYPGEPVLIVDGWVEYPYSQTMFAAWQAGAAYGAPTIEARDKAGEWRTIQAQFGYPAGMPRRMSFALAHLPAGARTLRLRTNMEVYWDRVAIAFAEPVAGLKRQMLPLQRAELKQTGFPKRTTGAQRRPDFDYHHRRPFWDTRYMTGWYTRLGAIDALLAEVDDAVAIFGPGEEVHLEFKAAKDQPPKGWKRYFVLETHGWTKDMDLYTRNGSTITPLPHQGTPDPARKPLHARFNTRYQDGY